MLVPNWTLMDCDLATPANSAGADWQVLTRRSLAASGHNLPELILPALAARPGGELATVRDSGGLRLAVPLQHRRAVLPFRANWSSPINFHGIPHVDRDFAVPALMALLRRAVHPILFHSVPVGGLFWDALTASAGHMAVLGTHERAVLRPEGTYSQWFEANFERKRRKEYRRLQARLSEQGRLEMLSHQPGADVGSWVNEFLDLEAAGWKGRRGTAMKSAAGTAAILLEACRGLSASGSLRFWKLALDGKPVAMLFAVVDGKEAWLGKIAHDESLARFSPGVLLILHATGQLFGEALTQVDSCAIPEHPMINHLWRDRLAVADVMVAAPSMHPVAFALTATAERLRRRARAAARNLFYRFSGRHPS